MKYLKHTVIAISLLIALLYVHSPHHLKSEFGAAGFSFKWLLPVGSDPLLINTVCRETTPADFKIRLEKEDAGEQIFIYQGKPDKPEAEQTACSFSNIGIWGISRLQPKRVMVEVTNSKGVLLFSGTGNIDSLKDGQLKNSGTITLLFSGMDKESPSNPSAVINSGDEKTLTRLVNIEISATDNRGVTGYLLSEKRDIKSAGKTWKLISPSMTFRKKVTFLLSGGEGEKSVSAWFRDAAGNISSRKSASIIRVVSDNIPPVNRTSPDFPEYEPVTESTGKILLKISATDNKAVAGYLISTSSATPAPGDPAWHRLTSPRPDFSDNVSFKIKKTAKTQSISIWFIDKAGNISDSVTGVTKIRVNIPPPHPPKKIKPVMDTTPPDNLTKNNFINKGEKETFQNILTLEISASDSGSGVTGYMLGKTAAPPAPGHQGWISLPPAKYFSDTIKIKVKGNPGEKSVYVWFKDASGNVSDGMHDSVILKQGDHTPPVNTTPDNFINTGNRITSSSTVFLSINASDKDRGINGYFLSESGKTPLAADKGWTMVSKAGKFSSLVRFTLGPYNGKKTVYVWFKDSSGNISNRKSDSIQKRILKKLPDTGQRQRFADTFFFGEDADYTTNPMQFVDNKDGTVKDTVTGLLWQNPIGSSPKTWEDAVGYCDSLIFGNNSLRNWRLPGVSELLSIVDYSKTEPAINSHYFPGTMRAFYWTSTQYASFKRMAWYVDFNFGTAGYYRFKTNLYNVRCVHDDR